MEESVKDFGLLVFSEKQMHERLPKPVYQAWKKTVSNEGLLDRPTADAIAHAMKRWALENGATHYTHWFQPLTGTTAEKHDAFIEMDKTGDAITRFSGKSLIKGEPDASSFPSGGLRATFEARGYTYWDVTSPAFIKDDVLCIPTIFVSYHGESLDKKGPLLKSIRALSDASVKVVRLLGDKDVKSCSPSVGLEQEYFLIDHKYYEAREDLKLTGRTLLGCPAPKGQELSDHYFGSIPTRVKEFMKEVNQELWKLGIYAKTEHNEVAPGQFELAPIFTPCNIAVDQNQLIMDVLKKTAEKHGFACLLHEKPFAKINGSGKHNNWSIVTDDGQNLFAPGDKPAENIRFLLFVCAFMQAVDRHALLLRYSASSTGNDHRLGANEAPPAIISIYLGSYIENILDYICGGKSLKETEDAFTSIAGLAYLPHDNTDRNRTSPVAFTGNKFEFRMLGSSMSASTANTVLNAIMAESLNTIAEKLTGKTSKENQSIAFDICKEIINDHRRILYSGDGYSNEWIAEAKRKGLPNVSSYAESIDVLSSTETIQLFTSLGIFTKAELESRKAIAIEEYIHRIEIESKTLLDMVRRDIFPAMQKDMIETKMISETQYGKEHLKDIMEELDDTYKAVKKLSDDLAIIPKDDLFHQGKYMHDVICEDMKEIREYVDTFEACTARKYIPLPTYTDMLFID